MAFDSETSVSADVHPHPHSSAHRAPHSHGGAGLKTAATATEAGPLANTPSMSFLRLSIQARLASAAVFAVIIWVAIHWATL